MKNRKVLRKKIRKHIGYISLCAALVCAVSITYAQSQGANGITDATQQVKGYFSIGCDLMYAVGAITGLVGAVKVFNKWNSGDHDTSKVAAAWFGSCVFLVVVATILKGFFGV